MSETISSAELRAAMDAVRVVPGPTVHIEHRDGEDWVTIGDGPERRLVAASGADRIAEITRQLAEIDARRAPLAAERSQLVSEQARREYPDGPFTLHVWRHFSPYEDEYDRPLEALRAAEAIEDAGSGSTERITDRHGNEIYNLRSYPPERVAEGYPEVPDDL